MSFRSFLPALPSAATRALRWRIVKLAGRDFIKDNGPSWAAAIAYYSLLSLFPLLLLIGSVAAYFVEAQWAVQRATYYLGVLLPRGPTAIDRIIQETLTAARGSGFLLVIPLIWSGTLVFGAVTKALNIIFDAEETVGFGERLLARLAMLLTLGVLFLVALTTPLVFRFLQWGFGILPIGEEVLFQLVVNALPPITVSFAFLLAYRYVPQKRPAWRPAVAGAILSGLLFAAAKPVFLGYLKWLGRYSLVYGSLAGIIVVILWAWIVAMIGLFGAQVAAHAQKVFIEGHPIDRLERRQAARTRKTRDCGPEGGR